MSTRALSLLLAEIPLLDWTGPPFLAFYVVALVGCLIWSARRLERALQPYEVPGLPPALEDPYDVAFLSAGTPRVAQMAVSRLILMGAASWKPAVGVQGARLLGVESAAPQDLTSAEQTLWHLLRQAGGKGVPVASIMKTLAVHIVPLEAKLASGGLRPTASERNKAGFFVVKPMLWLLGLGLLKTVIGLTRDKPVLFLAALLFFTLIAIFILISKVPRVTEPGLLALEKLRTDWPKEARKAEPVDAGSGNLNAVCMSLALFGPAVLSGLPGFGSAATDLARYLGQSPSSADGGGGCSSGCGASSSGGCGSSGGGDGGGSCGGGGCGGCGGG